MFDGAGLQDARHSGSIEHAGYPLAMKSPDPFTGVFAPAARRTSEYACLHCPVQKRSMCGALHGAELAALGDLKHIVHYKRKAVLFDQGERADCVHIVTEGGVRLYKTMPDGRRQIIGFALPGDLLGLAIDNSNAYSAEALIATSACRFSRKAFGELLDQMPHLLQRMHAMMSHELSIAQDHMMLLGQYSARQKVAAFVLQVRDRWRMNGASVHVPLPMSRQDIADYLGLSIETVSRTLGRLERMKLLVVVPDGVRILDIDRLGKLVGE
jgi:CRP/FNR family transcriptional regulator